MIRIARTTFRAGGVGALLALWMIIAPVSVAQDFYINRSSPETGTPDVPLTATIVFEYNRTTGFSTPDWNTAIVEPRDKIRITNAELCLGEETCSDGDLPRFVRYKVEHQPNTDYTWTVYSTRTFERENNGAIEDTVWMAEPYVLRYSTGSDMGSATVEGSVKSLQPEAPLAARTKNLLRTLITTASEAEVGTAVVAEKTFDVLPTPSSSDSAPASMDAQTPLQAANATPHPEDHTLVLLLDDFSLEEGDWKVAAGTIIQGDQGAYDVKYVRDGTYWPIAVRFADRERTSIEGIGFYDANGDRGPDSVTINGNAADDIDLTLFDFPLTTARTNLGLAATRAVDLSYDHHLVEIVSAYGARPSGTAYDWIYRFYSPDLDEVATITVGPFGVETESASPSGALAEDPALPSIFIDSDQALEIVMEDGGQDFIDDNAYRPANLSTLIHGGHFEEQSAEPFWYVRLTGRTVQETKTFERYVSMANGQVYSTPEKLASARSTAGDTPVAVEQNYPNPFSDATHISFTLPASSAVTVTIYDLLGRRVASLLDGQHLSTGTHTLRWDASAAPSGTYFFRIQTEKSTDTRGMTLQR